MNKERKASRQEYPPDAADQGLFEGNDAAFTVPDRQVQEQQRQNDRIKDDPEPDAHLKARLEIKRQERERVLLALVLGLAAEWSPGKAEASPGVANGIPRSSLGGRHAFKSGDRRAPDTPNAGFISDWTLDHSAGAGPYRP